ncbi:MAG TPA: oligopeptidase A, partial [Burkholderiaceae bacterium]|nr:oligopeptidase A [Burkholderiaceae bacterium]
MTQPNPPTNPLLDATGLPRFDEIRAEHVGPAIDELLRVCDAALERVTSDAVPSDYDAMSAVLDVATERLSRAWGAVGHLCAVADTPALRAAQAEALPRVVDFHTRLGTNRRLFEKYQAVLADAPAKQLDAARRKALADTVRDFRLSGVELTGAAKERFVALQDAQAERSQHFADHVLDATDGFAYFAGVSELDGVPGDVKQAARTAAAADGHDGFKLTLHAPCYLPVMQYATSRALRERLYTAYVTRASDLGPPELDNSAAMRE